VILSFLGRLPREACALAMILFVCLGAMDSARGADNHPVRRVKVLFLGDEGHHVPLLRARQLIPIASQNGIDIEYTQDVNDLNGAKLNQFDCLLIYANIDQISPEHEKALLDYVESGHGLVALHCASFCFQNSPKYIALVGAQFAHHDTGVFRTTIVAPDHPIMKGFVGFESWDESYVHAKHNTENRTVLEMRDTEPYTWVRAQGKGRVFYTAWGHDERTWGNPGFQDLVERGIRWAAGDWAMGPQTQLSAFEYVQKKQPKYLHVQKWGVNATGMQPMQLPLPSEESIKHMVAPQGFSVKYFAGDPLIYKPVCMAWDERGRLWVSETVDYPNQMQEPGKGHDRIIIIEDSTGKGVADKVTVFADQLSIPTSICFANAGIIVAQAPDILFLKSTKGDDKADVKQVLLTGFGTRDTHAECSNLRWGFDGWIYGTVGYSGFEGTVGGEQVHFGQGFFRFKPDGSKLEFLGSTNNNTWGLGVSEDNHIFASTANGNPSFDLAIPNRYYERAEGLSARGTETIADTPAFYPMTDKIRQVDNFGAYTAGAGSDLYTARSFPREYWNRIQFVAEPTGHLLGKFILNNVGSAVRAINDFNLLASDDEWTAPIAGEVGPDGAVWMIDWYNYIIQHNPIPEGFQGGKGGAYETELRDKSHGRIYRIVWDAAAPHKPMDLHDATAAQLVEALKNDNLFWRLTAQRLLIEKGDKSVVPELIKLTADPGLDAIGLNTAAIHALWTMHGLGVLDGSNADAFAAAVAALEHPCAAVRRNAALVLPPTSAASDAILDAKLLEDKDPQVRRTALLALSELPPSDKAAAAILDILSRKENADDRWIPDAATIAACRNDAGFQKALFASYKASSATTLPAAPQNLVPNGSFEEVKSAPGALPGLVGTVASAVIHHYARRGPVDSVVSTLTAVQNADPQLASVVIDSLADGWPQGIAPQLGADDLTALHGLMGALPANDRTRLVALTKRWGRGDIFAAEMAQILEGLRTTVADASLDPAKRVDAAENLVGLDDTDAAPKFILKQITAQSAPDLQEGLVEAIGSSTNAGVGALLTANWTHFSPGAQRKAVGLLLRKPHWTGALLDALESRKIQLGDLNPQDLQLLTQNSDATIAERAKKIEKDAGMASNPDRQKVIDQFQSVTEKTGDIAAGKVIFEKNCMVCHTFEGRGAQVGPELTGIGMRPKTELIIKILDPNRSVEGTYKAWTAETKNGDTFVGRLATESLTSVELIDAQGHHVIQRSDLKLLRSSNRTLMPEGFESLGLDGLANVMEYLQTSKVKH